MPETGFMITDGPCKFDLMVSLMGGKPSGQPSVQFTIRESADQPQVLNKLVSVITGLDTEDGSGDCWVIRGIVTNRIGHTGVQWRETGTIKGQYSTKNRQGTLYLTT